MDRVATGQKKNQIKTTLSAHCREIGWDLWLEHSPQIPWAPWTAEWFQFSSFLYFLKRSMYQEYKLNIFSSIHFYLNGLHLWLVGPWQTLLLQSFGTFCILNNCTVSMCFNCHHAHEVMELVNTIFVTFVRSIMLSHLSKHCCKVVFAFSQISLKS